jgi:hypothetical protein
MSSSMEGAVDPVIQVVHVYTINRDNDEELGAIMGGMLSYTFADSPTCPEAFVTSIREISKEWMSFAHSIWYNNNSSICAIKTAGSLTVQ